MLPELRPSAFAPAVLLEPERARVKLGEGIRLLRGEGLEIDASMFQGRWQRGCAALEAQPSPFDGGQSRAKALADALRDGRLEPRVMADAVLAGQPEAVRHYAEELGLEPTL